MSSRLHKAYHGVVVPMVTPVKSDQSLDREAVQRISAYCAQHGCALLLLGTTGESASVSVRDGRELVKIVSDFLGGKATIYACLTGNSVSDNMENAKAYIDSGADVIVSTLPGYYKIGPEQIHSYYLNLAESLNIPVMIYNIPSTTGMSIPLEVVEALSKHPNILGMKDSERDEQRLSRGITMFQNREDFSYFVGYAAVSAVSLMKGADGIVPSTGNVVPFMFNALYRAALSGAHEEARRLQEETDEIARIYQQGRSLGESIQALKVMMSELGFCNPVAIPPLQNLDKVTRDGIREATKKVMSKYNILNYIDNP